MISYKYIIYIGTCIIVLMFKKKYMYTNEIKQYLYHYGRYLGKNRINCKIYIEK